MLSAKIYPSKPKASKSNYSLIQCPHSTQTRGL